MRTLAAFIAVIVLGSVPLASSFAQRGVAPPRVVVTSLEPLPMAGTENRFRAVVLIDNMNTEQLRLRGIEFKLRLADQGIVDGAIGALTIEPLHQETVTLELGSEIVSSLSRLMSFVQGPDNTLPYEIYGHVTFARGRLDPMSFTARGHVPLVLPSAR
jgi:hypothetical protein